MLHDIISKNRRAGQIITELIGDDANPDRVKQELNSLSPIVICGIGHGNECYSEDTEILTENGWKHFEELQPSEKVAALSDHGTLEYELPIAHHKFFYKGKMLHIDGKRINLLVTPNHNLYCAWHVSKGRWSSFRFLKAEDIGKAGTRWELGTDKTSQTFIENERKTWELRKKHGYGARRISRILSIKESTVNDWLFYGRRAGLRYVSTGTTTGCCLKFKRTAIWNCQRLETFQLPSSQKIRTIKHGDRMDTCCTPIPEKNMVLEDWLRFFGIWLAEGSVSLKHQKGNYIIAITQNNNEKRKVIKEWVNVIAQAVGFSAWEEQSSEHSKAIKFKNKQMYEYLKQFGHAKDKFIPKEIKMLPPEGLRILLDAMVYGDGYVDSYGAIYYSTISKKLADDVQEIALKVGKVGIIHKDKRTGVTTVRITDDDACVTKSSIKWTEYAGQVYCVTVPNHLLYVRRNGRACWCGNSTYTVECTAKLFDTSSPDLNLLAKRVCSFCSCLTAIALGPAIIDAGAVAYTGYKTEFWFFIGDAPGSTRAVQSPFLAEFEFVASLLRGSSTGVARSDQLKKCDEEIAYWISGEGKNHESAGELSRILEMNKANSVFLGEGGVSPSSGAVAAAGFSSWPWMLAFLITGVLAYGELKS